MLVDKNGVSHFLKSINDIEVMLEDCIGGNVKFYLDSIIEPRCVQESKYELEQEIINLFDNLDRAHDDYNNLMSKYDLMRELLYEILDDIDSDKWEDRINDAMRVH